MPARRPFFRRPIGVALGLSTLVLVTACSRQEPAPEPVRAVRTMKVSSDAAVAYQEFAGDVRARVETRLGFRVGGKMVSRSVGLGDEIRRGQVLAALDPTDLKLGQDAAAAAVRAAQASWDLASADLKRYRELHSQGFIGGAEIERRESVLKSAQAALDQAKAQVGVQGHQAQYANLVADAAGVITGVDAEPGTVLGAGTPVFRVALAGPRDVVFNVPEDRVGAVRALLRRPDGVEVRVWGNDPAVPLHATLREVSAAADPATRTFLAKADLGANTARLGQTVTVRVEEARRDAVTRLPLSAVAEQGGKSVVWLLDPAAMTVKAQPVEVSGADGNQVLVASGLKAGQEVVTAGVHVLTPGLKVRRYVEPVRPAASR